MEAKAQDGSDAVEAGSRRALLSMGSLGILGVAMLPKTAQAQSPTGIEGVFNVKDYGARGDGSNDTAAIQAAINAALAVQHGVVYFPPNAVGSAYLITCPLVINAPIRIVGAGPRAVTIWAQNMALGQFVLDFNCNAVDVVQHVEVSGLTIRSNNSQPTGMRIKNVSYFLVKNVVAYNLSDGVLMTGLNTYSITFEQFTAYNLGHFSVFLNGASGGHYSFVSSTFCGNTGVFIDQLSAVNAVSFVNCNFEQCTTNSFYTGGTVQGLSFTGCRTEGCDGHDFQINPVLGKIVAGLSITGCYFTSDTAASKPILLGGAGGKVRGFNICGNYTGYGSNVFVTLNGEGESGVIAGNYFSGANVTPTNVYRPGIRAYSNENSTSKSLDMP